jgi:hypothetical protein
MVKSPQGEIWVPESLEHLVAGIAHSPQRADLLAGFIALCRTDKNPIRQANALVSCANAILSAQPLVALKVLQVALAVAPKHSAALALAKEIFRRRGRWASEQRIAELLSTQTHVSALTPLPDDLRSSVVETAIKIPEPRTEQMTAPVFSSEPFTELKDQPEPEPVPEPVLEPVLEPVPEPEPQSKPAVIQSPEPPTVQQSKPELAQQEDRVMTQPIQKIAEAHNDFEQGRVDEYLRRCGFDASWLSLAAGFSKSNAGLVSFVGMLVGLNMINADEKPLAGMMLLKMITEKPDESGAQEILARLFPELVTKDREGK